MNAPGRMITHPVPVTALAPEVNPADTCRAVRAVASLAVDAADCALLLDVLGLKATDGRLLARPRATAAVASGDGYQDTGEPHERHKSTTGQKEVHG